MGQPLTWELRKSQRRRLDGRTCGKLIIASSGIEIEYKGHDVSRTGLGIHSDFDIMPEVDLQLHIGEVVVELEIVWGLQRQKDKPTMRYGIRVVDESLDLEELLESNGC